MRIFFKAGVLFTLSSLSFAGQLTSYGSGATVAGGDGWRTPLDNPALLAQSRNAANASLSTSFSVRIEETPEFRKASRHFEHTFRAFDENSPYSYLSESQREGMLDELESLDGNEHTTEIQFAEAYRFNAASGWPFSVFFNARMFGHLRFNYDERDRTRYINPQLTPELYEASQKLNPQTGSHMDMNAVSLTDIGISTAITTDSGLSVGGSLKIQGAHLLSRKVVYEDYVDPHYSDYLSEHYRPTADLGFHQIWGKDSQWVAGLLLKDMGSWENISVEGQTFEVITLPIAGLGYRGERIFAQIQVSLDTQFDFGILKGPRPTIAQLDYQANDSLSLRLLARHDQNGFNSNALQLGAYLKPTPGIAMNFTLEGNDQEGFGLGFGLSLSFGE